jgi:hypothetical protein
VSIPGAATPNYPWGSPNDERIYFAVAAAGADGRPGTNV